MATIQYCYKVFFLNESARDSKGGGVITVHRRRYLDGKQFEESYEGVIEVPEFFNHEKVLDAIFRELNVNTPKDYFYRPLSFGDAVALTIQYSGIFTLYRCERTKWKNYPYSFSMPLIPFGEPYSVKSVAPSFFGVSGRLEKMLTNLVRFHGGNPETEAINAYTKAILKIFKN